MLLHARALCNRARELLEWAAQEALEVRLLRHPLACSWRSLSTCNTTKAVALSLYRRARRTSSNFRLSLLVVSLSLCVSLLRRDSSLPGLCFYLCRRSAFVPADASSLRFVSPALAFCTRLCYRLYSSLSHFCLGYASRSSRAILHPTNTSI